MLIHRHCISNFRYYKTLVVINFALIAPLYDWSGVCKRVVLVYIKLGFPRFKVPFIRLVHNDWIKSSLLCMIDVIKIISRKNNSQIM